MAALQVFLGVAETGALTYRLALQQRRAELQAVLADLLGAGENDWRAIWLPTHGGSRCFDIRLRRVEDSAYKLDHCQIIVMHDVTAHQQAIEQARRAERDMSLFMAAMSHEIRGPLHSVLGAAHLLRDASPAEAERLMELLTISARALNETLENVLSFSRFERQSPKPRPEPVALRKALGDLVRIKDIQARQQGVPLRLHVAAEVPAAVSLDWSMARQILSNLIQNALQHDDGRGVAVSLACQPDQPGQPGSLVFEVADHGPGLPDDMAAMLAAAPAELRPRLTDGYGSGLGLAIAQRMALALGGQIAALPASGGGARLQVRLPLALAASAPPPPAPCWAKAACWSMTT